MTKITVVGTAQVITYELVNLKYKYANNPTYYTAAKIRTPYNQTDCNMNWLIILWVEKRSLLNKPTLGSFQLSQLHPKLDYIFTRFSTWDKMLLF